MVDKIKNYSSVTLNTACKNNENGSCNYTSKPRHARDTLKLFLLDEAKYSKEHELPMLHAVQLEEHPVGLVPFSIAMQHHCKDFDCFVHFYEDDYLFLRIWNNPKRYLPKLKKFAGIIMPDFSVCIDFPKSLKMWSCYRNQALGAWFQRQGLICIPSARHEPRCDFLLEALPKQSTIAICGRALTKNTLERRRFVRDIKTTIDVLKPSSIIYYGSNFYHVMDYPRSLKIPVWMYRGCGRGSLDGGRHGYWKQ